MRVLLAVLTVLALSAPGVAAQSADEPCRLRAEEQRVLEAVLDHFQILEGTVEVGPFARPVPSRGYDPAFAAAVSDFNARNAEFCTAGDGPVAGVRLFAGPQKTRLSRPGLDLPADAAFAEITVVGDPEIGASHFVLLRKQAGTWRVVQERMYRMF